MTGTPVVEISTNPLPQTAPNTRSRRSFLPETGASMLLFLTLAGSFGAWHWTLDLISHFRWYYFVVALIGIIAIIRTDRRFTKFCLCVAMFWNGALLFPYYVPAGTGSIPDSAFRVSLISLNVFRPNPNKSKVVEYLRDRQPDLIIAMEVDQQWTDALEELSNVYPYRRMQPRQDNFGIGLLSKWPLVDVKVVEFAGTEVPNIVATVERDGTRFRLIGTHPLPPIGAEQTRERDSQLLEIADFVRQSRIPTIVAGDFNATPWSAAFRQFTDRSGLRDSALGRGVHGTWNVWSPIRIPIDQTMIPVEATVIRRTVGPDVGSDHFPLEVVFAIH
jgi:endonuclease/exonuclease/phosphatase (EEP) superfamily protein YafD